MAILENKPFQPDITTFWSKVEVVNQFMKTEQSIYALKVAAIGSVFSVLCMLLFFPPRVFAILM